MRLRPKPRRTPHPLYTRACKPSVSERMLSTVGPHGGGDARGVAAGTIPGTLRADGGWGTVVAALGAGAAPSALAITMGRLSSAQPQALSAATYTTWAPGPISATDQVE